MKEEPPGQTSPRHTPWKALLSILLVTTASAVTVLGAVLLSLQGQAPTDQLVVRQPESTAAEYIPTAAIATPPPVTLLPTTPRAETVKPTAEASPTRPAKPQDMTPSPSAEISATSIPAGTVGPVSSATPLLCAGGAPMDWKLYIVQHGDTLFSLARRHGTTTDRVAYYNCLSSDTLWAGQRLYLPPVPTPPPSTSATPTAVSSPTSTLAPSSTAVQTPTATPSPDPPTTLTPTARPASGPAVSPTLTFTPRATAPVSPVGTATSTPTAEPNATSVSRPTLVTSSTPTPSLTPDLSPEATEDTTPQSTSTQRAPHQRPLP